jgi:hypothetical protein
MSGSLVRVFETCFELFADRFELFCDRGFERTTRRVVDRRDVLAPERRVDLAMAFSPIINRCTL